jgi:hypothetical protein
MPSMTLGLRSWSRVVSRKWAKTVEKSVSVPPQDPEHKVDPGDWGSFWEDRGFSGDAEPSDVWV